MANEGVVFGASFLLSASFGLLALGERRFNAPSFLTCKRVRRLHLAVAIHLNVDVVIAADDYVLYNQ